MHFFERKSDGFEKVEIDWLRQELTKDFSMRNIISILWAREFRLISSFQQKFSHQNLCLFASQAESGRRDFIVYCVDMRFVHVSEYFLQLRAVVRLMTTNGFGVSFVNKTITGSHKCLLSKKWINWHWYWIVCSSVRSSVRPLAWYIYNPKTVLIVGRFTLL